MLADDPICTGTTVRFVLEGVTVVNELGGCGRKLRRTAYTNRKGEHQTLVTCSHCDSIRVWPGRAK